MKRLGLVSLVLLAVFFICFNHHTVSVLCWATKAQKNPEAYSQQVYAGSQGQQCISIFSPAVEDGVDSLQTTFTESTLVGEAKVVVGYPKETKIGFLYHATWLTEENSKAIQALLISPTEITSSTVIVRGTLLSQKRVSSGGNNEQLDSISILLLEDR